MGYKYGNPTNRLKAAEMLKKLLPEAREMAEKNKSETSIEATSAVGAASLKWYDLEHCNGLHIYQGEKGGWFADLSFHGLPDGISRIIGTPVSMPCRTREDAVRIGISLLASIISNPKIPAEERQNDPEIAFSFDEINLFLPSSLISQMRDFGGEPPSDEYVFKRFEELREQFAGGKPFTKTIMDSLSSDDRMKVITICALAIFKGIPKYPMPEESPPPPPLHKMH